MGKITGDNRVFLFLQGPHGPFFHLLGKMLERAGASVWRVGFNAGDRAFWFSPKSYVPYRGTLAQWDARFAEIVAEKGVTDIVLYGDTRPIHAQAVAAAKALGLGIHVFEEGYMRPYWVTYERGGSNGNSRLMKMSLNEMQAGLAHTDMDTPAPCPLGRHAPTCVLWCALPLVCDVSERAIPQLPASPRAERDKRIPALSQAPSAHAVSGLGAGRGHLAYSPRRLSLSSGAFAA